MTGYAWGGVTGPRSVSVTAEYPIPVESKPLDGYSSGIARFYQYRRLGLIGVNTVQLHDYSSVVLSIDKRRSVANAADHVNLHRSSLRDLETSIKPHSASDGINRLNIGLAYANIGCCLRLTSRKEGLRKPTCALGHILGECGYWNIGLRAFAHFHQFYNRVGMAKEYWEHYHFCPYLSSRRMTTNIHGKNDDQPDSIFIDNQRATERKACGNPRSLGYFKLFSTGVCRALGGISSNPGETIVLKHRPPLVAYDRECLRCRARIKYGRNGSYDSGACDYVIRVGTKQPVSNSTADQPDTEPHYFSGLLLLGLGFIAMLFGMRFCVDGWRGLPIGILLIIVGVLIIWHSAALLDPNLRGGLLSAPARSDSRPVVRAFSPSVPCGPVRPSEPSGSSA